MSPARDPKVSETVGVLQVPLQVLGLFLSLEQPQTAYNIFYPKPCSTFPERVLANLHRSKDTWALWLQMTNHHACPLSLIHTEPSNNG